MGLTFKKNDDLDKMLENFAVLPEKAKPDKTAKNNNDPTKNESNKSADKKSK